MAFSIKDEKWDQLLRLEEDPTPPKTSKFMSLSIAMHSILAILAALMATPLLETPEMTTIEFEISDSAIPLGELVPETRGSSPAPIIVQSEPAAVVETKAPQAQKSVSQPKITQPTSKASARVSSPAQVNEAPMEAPSFEELSSQMNLESTPTSELSDADLDQAIQSVSSNQESLESLAQELSAEAETFAGESDLALADAEVRAESQLKSLAASRAEKRAQEMAAIQQARQLEEEQSRAAAAAQAAASAAAAQAAQEEADRIAQAQAAEKVMARGNGGGSGSGIAQARGMGAGNNGSNQTSTSLAGSPQGAIRKLEQLRQMPGNRKPMYSINERRSRQSGVVVFQAYVTQQGRLKDFRQIRTTGYANLDEKAFKALKEWKFYPGQEGWVELPFVWSLVGEEKAIGGGLRSR